MNIKTIMSLIALSLSSSLASAATFTIEKEGYNFSIDGNGGAIEGQQLYLWGTKTTNVNQQWVQLNRGDGYYSYKKNGTNLCWDGGDGGAKRQAITLETCAENDYNQHWAKVKITSGTEKYRIEKRNASGWSIDGNGGAAERQSLYLWTSSDSNVNQQWNFNNIEGTDGGGDGELTINTIFDDGTSHASYPASKANDGSSAWASRWAAQAGGDAVNLTAQFDSTQSVSKVGVSWGRGDSRTHTFEIYARNATSGTWTQVYDGVSNGSTADIEIYDVTDIDARQVRLKVQSNSSGSNWANVTELKVYSDGDTPCTTCGETGEDIPSNITDGSIFDLEGDDPHPLVNSSTLEFVALETKVTTPNGNGWRHEYKVEEDQRVAMTDTYEYFKANIKVELSDGGKTIVAQHHAGDTGTIMKLYVADSSESDIGDSNPGDGVFAVYVRIRNTSGVEEKKALGTIKSGDSFSFEVINDYGVVTVSAFGEKLETEVEDDSESYFKFGNYLQSQYPNGSVDCGESGDSDSFADCFADIGITKAKITMTDVSYTRTVK